MDRYAEIVELQNRRLDLFKWKIILIAALGGVATGFIGAHPAGGGLPLALIPVVCVYVDLLCRDLTLRVVAITRYLQLVQEGKAKESATEYAAFVARADQMQDASKPLSRDFWKECIGWLWDFSFLTKPSAYGFVFLAQESSTIASSLGVIWWGSVLKLRRPEMCTLRWFAILGIVFTVLFYLAYKHRDAAVKRLSLPPRNDT
jgi:hypothetical protein